MLTQLYLYLQNLLRKEEGQDLVEYALLILLIAVVALVFVPDVTDAIEGIFDTIATALSGAS